MSREIKYRAWDVSNKLMSEPVKPFENQHTKFVMSKDYVASVPTADIDSVYGYEHIIMQYTGLKDKNGVEIYEGDIVRNRGYSELCIVEWYQGQYIGRYSPQNPHYPLDEMKKISERGDLCYIGLGFYAIERNSFEVIGNIYENPNLLEDGETA